MQSSGYTLNHSRVSIKKLAEISGTSEQICRCYIRGVALPNYKRIILIAKSLKVSPGWLLFGTENLSSDISNENNADDNLVHAIIKKTAALFKEDLLSANDYAEFVVNLINDIRGIGPTEENLEKIIKLTFKTIFSYKKAVRDRCNQTH